MRMPLSAAVGLPRALRGELVPELLVELRHVEALRDVGNDPEEAAAHAAVGGDAQVTVANRRGLVVTVVSRHEAGPGGPLGGVWQRADHLAKLRCEFERALACTDLCSPIRFVITYPLIRRLRRMRA